MPSIVRRLVSPIIATKARGFVTLPVGSIIEAPDSLEEPGLRSVRFGGEEIFTFTRDIQERTEPVNAAPEYEPLVIPRPRPGTVEVPRRRLAG